MLSFVCISQSIVINGKVFDKQTEEPIPFANVYLKSEVTTGTTSDFDGNFSFTIEKYADSIAASSLGYNTDFRKIIDGQNPVSVNFYLERADYALKEVVIRPGENPAIGLMKKVIAKKHLYDKNRLDSYGYEVYNKIEIDLDELTEKFKNRKVFKPFKLVFSNIDSTSEEKPFLPFFLSESVSDFHYRKTPLDKREIIKASKVSDINNSNISQFLGTMYVNIDIYKDWILLLNRDFISPISSTGLSSYKYYIIDSAQIEQDWCYKVQFIPKRKGELTFNGDMWIADSAFSVKQISMKISKDADVNFVRNLSLYNEFTHVQDSVWMLRKEKLIINFIKPEKGPGLIGRKTSSYKDFTISESKANIDSLFKKQKRDIIIKDSAALYGNEYWNKIRHDSLTQNEGRIYGMIDTLKNLPIVKTYLDLIQTIYLGFKDVGPISFGNIWSFVSNNKVEGWRLKLGISTSNKFSKNVYLYGYAAYGFKDKKVKYGGEFKWIIKKDPRQMIQASYRNDILYGTNFDNFYSAGNLLANFGVRRWEENKYIPIKLLQIKEVRASYFVETNFGYSAKVGFTQRYLRPVGDFSFQFHTDANARRANRIIDDFTQTEFSLFQRFSWQEKFISGEFERLSLGSKYPELYLNYAVGVKRIANGDFPYQKITFGISDYQHCGPLGKLYWQIEAGKLFGTAPFPILFPANTNESYIYNWNGFNLLKMYEFVHDRYVGVLLNQHFGGLLFNRIPGIRKLKLRESFTFRMLWGDMTNANQQANFYNSFDNKLNFSTVQFKTASHIPYMEAGFGIENILKFIRIDAIWRLTHLDKRGSPFSFKYANFGVRVGFQLQF